MQPEVVITVLEAGEDPAIQIFHIELRAIGVWTETFGTADLAQAFLRGVKAGYGINSVYPIIPDLPVR